VTPRQQYLKTLLFDSPDRIPFAPGDPRETTLVRWHQEGLPEEVGLPWYDTLLPGNPRDSMLARNCQQGLPEKVEVNWYDYLCELLGLEKAQTQASVDLGVSFQMIPKFEEKILEHKNGHYLVRDWMGAITEISDEYDYTYIRQAKDFVTRRWWQAPVTNRDEWEEMKTRYDPHDYRRFPRDFEQRCSKLQERDYVAGLNISGLFWQLREWVGFEVLCVLMIEQPDWVHEMIQFWTEFVAQTLTPILQRVELDWVGFSEDMAYKNHSMISPQMCREFLLPCWQRWATQIKTSGCPVVWIDSDGYVDELIPLWIEAGMNAELPNEVAAGCDVVRFREQYGQKMGYVGGIDKQAIAAGGDVMHEEVTYRCSILAEGGYIPGCDHGIPPDVSWPNFVEYSRLLAQLTGWL